MLRSEQCDHCTLCIPLVCVFSLWRIVLHRNGHQLGSWHELSRHKQRNQAIEKAMRERRNDNVVKSARTGRHTLRSLAEQYNISEQTVQSILSDTGVSLAEIKAQRMKEKRKK